MRNRIPVLLFFLAAGLFLPARLAAQRVYWSSASATLGVGQTSELRLVFEDCRPTGSVTLPSVDGLQFGTPSTSQETSIINMKMSSRMTLSYPVQPARRGTLVIPSFDVRTDIGSVAVGEIKLQVGDASVGGTGGSSVAVADIIESHLRPARTTLWAGEVAAVDYVIAASPQYNTSLGSLPDWQPEGVVFESFGKDGEHTEERVRGQRWAALKFSTRFLVPTPGHVALDPVHQSIRIQTGERAGFFFSQPRIEEFTIASNQPALTVKPLPSPAPAGFAGAVGTFKLESTVVPQNARIGEPVTWTLKLSGTGNWSAIPSLPEREVSADFEVIQPKSRQEMEPDKLFSGSLTEDAVLVPMHAGTYTLGPVKFAYFDPAAGTYRTLTTEKVNVTIHPGTTAAVPTPTPATGPSTPSSPTGNAMAAATPSAPLPLPADISPLPGLPEAPLAVGTIVGRAPSKSRPLAWLAAVLVPPVLLWLALAWISAIRNDPSRDRRRAHRELGRLLQRLARTNHAPDVASIEGWRTYTARMWGIQRAVPTSEILAAAIRKHGGTKAGDVWTTLWTEAEDALFGGPDRALPADWKRRAAAVLAQTRVLRVEPAFPLRRRHWAPFATVLALATLGLQPPDVRADEAAVQYQDGQYAKARSAWQKQLPAASGDAGLHNNIALTYAQEDRWPEAVAHWTSACLLHPRDPVIRRNLRLGLGHLDRMDPVLRKLVSDARIDRVVTFLAPAEWQYLQTAGILAITLGLTAIVIAFYRRRGSAWRWSGSVLAVIGIAAVGAGIEANRLYGPLADPTVAIVTQATDLHSIPTDLAERQQTAPITPGTIVVRAPVSPFTLIGWHKVNAGQETVGWLRRGTFQPIYTTTAR